MSNSKAITAVKLMMSEVERLSKYVDLSLREVDLIEGHAVIVSQKNHGCTAVYVFTFTDSPCTTPFTSDLVKWLLQLGDDANVVTTTTAVPVEFEITEESVGTLLGLALNFLTVTLAHRDGYRGNNLKSIQSTTKGEFIVGCGKVVSDTVNAMGAAVTASHASFVAHTSAIGGYVEIVDTYGYTDNDKFVITLMTSDSSLSPDMIILGICAIKLTVPGVNSVAFDLSQSAYLTAFFSLFNESGRSQLEEYVSNMTDGAFVSNDEPMFEEDRRTLTSSYLDRWVSALKAYLTTFFSLFNESV